MAGSEEYERLVEGLSLEVQQRVCKIEKIAGRLSKARYERERALMEEEGRPDCEMKLYGREGEEGVYFRRIEEMISREVGQEREVVVYAVLLGKKYRAGKLGR